MRIRRSISTRLLAGLAIILAVAGLTACNPVGAGIGPVRLVVNGPNGTLDAASGRVFECVRSGLSATLFFSNGSVGDFTSRVHWTSSNPAVVRVSNGDEPATAPATGFFPFGVLTPVAPGSSTVTATYQNYSDSIEISVGTPASVTVHTLDPQTGLRTDPPGNAFRLGIGTFSTLTVTALLDNVLTTISSAATWSFDAPNDAVATIDANTGSVTAVAAGGPLVARASFPACAGSPVVANASTTLSVAPIQSISIVPETSDPAFGTASNLFVGNVERFVVLGDFGDGGTPQDVSPFAVLTSASTDAATFACSISGCNLLRALAAGGPFNVSATLKQNDITLTAAPVPVTTVASTLQSLAAVPAMASVVAGSAEVASFHVIGTYVGGLTQDVTRVVGWTNDVAGVGTIIAGGAQAGQALSASALPGAVVFSAVYSTGSTVPAATATLVTTEPPPL